MTETLSKMARRVGTFQHRSVPDEQDFGLAPAVYTKVAPGAGGLLPYYGSTVIHYLADEPSALLDGVAGDLYTRLGSNLSERLPRRSFHVTLHDLRSSPHLEDVAGAVFLDDPQVSELVERARTVPPIEMRLTTVFNMLNTSVVVGLLPATEVDCMRLQSARSLFDAIVPSGPFTPHVTLAYYRPGAGVPIDPQLLRVTLEDLTAKVEGRPVTLSPDRLHSTHFSTMADYWAAGSR